MSFRNSIEKRVDNPDDMPAGAHHLIIVWEEVVVDDGYGENSKRPYACMYTFTNMKEWETAVKELALDEGQGYPKKKPQFVAYKNVSTTMIKIRVEVDVMDG